MSQFTKGPWADTEGTGANVIGPGNEEVAHCGPYGGMPFKEAQANARLIAAAPEMLEVLETIENDNGQVPDWLWERIKNVISKCLCLILALSVVSCSSVYVPTSDRYFDEVTELLHKHEDTVVVYYGTPDEVVELSEGTKLLVYNKLPYLGAPLLNSPIKQHTCRTVFQINEALSVSYIRSEGNFCVK